MFHQDSQVAASCCCFQSRSASAFVHRLNLSRRLSVNPTMTMCSGWWWWRRRRKKGSSQCLLLYVLFGRICIHTQLHLHSKVMLGVLILTDPVLFGFPVYPLYFVYFPRLNQVQFLLAIDHSKFAHCCTHCTNHL